jgi:hypothetical protein
VRNGRGNIKKEKQTKYGNTLKTMKQNSTSFIDEKIQRGNKTLTIMNKENKRRTATRNNTDKQANEKY